MHALGHRRAAALDDGVDLRLECGRIGQGLIGGKQVDAIVEQNERHAILRLHAAKDQLNGVAHVLDLVAGHRPAAVEHEAGVEGRVDGGSGRRCGCDLEQQVDLLRRGHGLKYGSIQFGVQRNFAWHLYLA